jgi:uncharacterized protein
MWKWLAVLLFLPLSALAEGLPPPLSDRVSDYDDLIPAATEARLADALQASRERTGVHAVLVVMRSRTAQGGAGMTVEDYGKALFNAWGVGDRRRNDGVMILVLTDDREMRIQLGKGFDAGWNAYAQAVIDDSFLPAFRDNRTLAGIETGTAAVIERIVQPFAAGQPAPSAGWGIAPEVLAWSVLAPLGFLAFAVVAMRDVIADRMVALRPCPKCGKKTLTCSRVVTDYPSTLSSGSGVRTTRCGSCDYLLEERYIIPPIRQSRSDSDSGSSGFGGGSSSGGGASGKW